MLDGGEIGVEQETGEGAEEGDGRSSGSEGGGEDDDGNGRMVLVMKSAKACEGIEVFWCGVKYNRSSISVYIIFNLHFWGWTTRPMRTIMN